MESPGQACSGIFSLKGLDDVNETDVGADDEADHPEQDNENVLDENPVVSSQLVGPEDAHFDDGGKGYA